LIRAATAACSPRTISAKRSVRVRGKDKVMRNKCSYGRMDTSRELSLSGSDHAPHRRRRRAPRARAVRRCARERADV
jgi:hypothetical protein